jgi:hypothetical protein
LRRGAGEVVEVRPRGALVAVAAFIVVGSMTLGAGTASATVYAKSTTAPPGFVVIPVKAAGVALAVPETWLAIDPKSSTAADALQAAADKNPKLASLLDQFQSLRSSITFWAVDPGATTFAANVLVLPSGLDKSALRQPAALEAALRQSLGTSVTSLTARKVRVAGAKGLEADADLTIKNSDGIPIAAYATVLFVPTEKGLIDIDYTSGAPRDSDPTLHTMVDSLRIT